MEGRSIKGEVDSVTIGYKYSRKNVFVLVLRKGARTTAVGKPYLAKFPDFFHVLIKMLSRLIILIKWMCTKKARQYDLALEKN